MNSIKSEFLKATNGGLDIFNHYLKQPIKIGERASEGGEGSFIIKWSDQYRNYALYSYWKNGTEWEYVECYAPIFYVAIKFDLSEAQAYMKIDKDMELGIFTEKVANSITVIG